MVAFLRSIDSFLIDSETPPHWPLTPLAFDRTADVEQ